MPAIDRLTDGLESGLINPFSITVLLFLAALLSAEVTVRVAHVPRIVALVVAGAAIGILRSVNATASLMPLPRSLLEVLALVLIFEVGQRVPLSWLRRNPWLLVTSLAESALTFVGVLSMLVLVFRTPMVESVFVGVICMTSPPIVVMCVSKDLAARGQIAERALSCRRSPVCTPFSACNFFSPAIGPPITQNWTSPSSRWLSCSDRFVLGTVAAGVLRLYVLLTDAAGAVLTIGIVCFCLLHVRRCAATRIGGMTACPASQDAPLRLRTAGMVRARIWRFTRATAASHTRCRAGSSARGSVRSGR